MWKGVNERERTFRSRKIYKRVETNPTRKTAEQRQIDRRWRGRNRHSGTHMEFVASHALSRRHIRNRLDCPSHSRVLTFGFVIYSNIDSKCMYVGYIVPSSNNRTLSRSLALSLFLSLSFSLLPPSKLSKCAQLLFVLLYTW